MALTLNYAKTTPFAREPQRFNETYAGYYLFAAENKIIPPNDVVKIDTGIILEMQGSYYAQIENIPEKENCLVLAGVIDPGYRGSIIIVLYNLTNEKQHIFKDEKIAQIVFKPVLLPKLIKKEEIEDVDECSTLETYIKFEKTKQSAFIPTRFEENSVGYDLHALEDVNIPPKETAQIDTGIILEMKGPFYGQILDKSGISSKHKLHVKSGVIDASHKSSIVVNFINLSTTEQYIKAGDKIAQIVFLPVVLPSLKLKNVIDMNTTRGTRGFQSGFMNSQMKCEFKMDPPFDQMLPPFNYPSQMSSLR